MADYIYLIQNRLTSAQRRALEAVRETARAQSMPVFLVGGAVRDLTSGSPVRDLDFAVQGDAGVLTGDLEARGATVAGENARFGSVYLTFPGGVRVEVGPTLSVTYPKPGQPETQTAVILDDLRRRDFTANAMAISLNEGSYGLLLDPLNGTADIENREFRLVSPYGFIEQPALLLRVARLTERLGWHMEERTQSRYENSKEEGHIQALPDADRGYELEELFHEEDPLLILEHLTAEGWRDVLFPGLTGDFADQKGLDEIRDLTGQLEAQGLHPDTSAVAFPLVTSKMPEQQRAALKKLFARQGFVRQIESLEARAKELAAQLTSKATALPSDTWRLLTSADSEVVLQLAYQSRSGAVQTKIKAFLKDWPQMRQKLPYAIMQEMRITPELPGYDKLLEDLFFALIDGKLDTPEATRAFLEPFSPPAPPQVTVRRRPAKAARGRAKKVVEDIDDDDAATNSHVSDDDEDLDQEDEDEDERPSRVGSGEQDPDDEDDDEDEEEEAEKADLKPVKKAVEKVPAIEKPGPVPRQASTVTAKAASAKSATETTAPPKSSAKGSVKSAVKTTASPDESTSSAATPAVAQAAPSPKFTPAAKGSTPAKAAGTEPKVTGTAKQTIVVVSKSAAKKTSPTKQVPVKKPAVAAKSSTPAKATTAVPAKAAKKVAATKGSTR